MIGAEKDLNEHDAVVGDGDCGQAFARGAKGILARINSSEGLSRCPDTFFNDVADAIRLSVGGSSGICYDLGFRAAANSIKNDKVWNEGNSNHLDYSILFRAFKAGVDSVSSIGGAMPGDRTMLDALYPYIKYASDYISSCIESSVDPVELLEVGA